MMHPDSYIRTARAFQSWGGWMLVLSLLLLCAPTGAVGQASELQALLKRGRQSGLDGAQIERVAQRANQAGLNTDATASLLRPAVELAERDLPADHLLSKTLEGLAKQVPPTRMEPVLKQLQTYTQHAGNLVGQWMEHPDVRKLIGATAAGPSPKARSEARVRLITAITEARQQNIPEAAVRSFLNDLPSAVERRPVPLAEVATAVSVLSDLPGSKRYTNASKELLTAALDAGYSAESLRQLPAALRSARRAAERPPAALVQGTAHAIARGTPATDVLRGLFQGSPPGVGPPFGVGNGPPGKGPGAGKPPGKGGKPPGTGPPDGPPGGGGPPDDLPGGGGSG